LGGDGQEVAAKSRGLKPIKPDSTAKRIWLNQDDAAFYRCHPISDMTVEGLEKLVDYYAQGTQLAGLAFCVNMQRALFASKTWETIIDGFDPKRGDDQPVIQRGGESRGIADLHRKGIDQFEVWLRRARHHKIEAWLTMRMNDCHGLEGHGDWWKGGRKKGEDQDHYQWHATEYWKAHPELRRAPYRYERSFESGFDFAHQAVRDHHLKFIAEIFERYDMDGFEMDWMRWLYFFAPGGEAVGRAILTDFIAQVNALRRQAEKKWGHPIGLRHRIPAEPQACDAIGFDVPAWVEIGAAEELILSSFGGIANFDYSIALWRRLVGPKVKIFTLAEPSASPNIGIHASSYHFLWGTASAALERGADGIYLFNECYREMGGTHQRRLFSEMLDSLGSPATLARRARRYAVSYAQIQGPGRGLSTQMPQPLTNPQIGTSFARMAETITLRIPIGRKSEQDDHVLCLGFSSDTPIDALNSMPIWLNTHPVSLGEKPEYPDLNAEAYPGESNNSTPKAAVHLRYYRLSLTALLSDVNIIELEPPAIAGSLVWAEIIAVPVLGA
jgi:hypothetical protein